VRQRESTVRRGIGWTLLAVCTVLLVSYGGAILAAPITVPLLFMTAGSSESIGYRVCAGIVAVLTIAETAWAVTYLTLGEAQPMIWVLPVLASLAVGAGFARMSRPSTL
jgi:hypothetical protein